MAYGITTVTGDGNVATSFQIADGTLDETSTTLALPGRNYSGYGLYIDQDLVDITQSWAGDDPPGNNVTSRLLAGQLWFNTSNATANTVSGTLNVYSGWGNGPITAPKWSTIVASDLNVDNQTSRFRGNLNIGSSVPGNISFQEGQLYVSNTANVGNTLVVANVIAVGPVGSPTITMNSTTSGNAITCISNVALTGNVTTIANLVTSNISPQVSNSGTFNGNWIFAGTFRANGQSNFAGNVGVAGTLTVGNLTANSNIAALNGNITNNLVIGGNLILTGSGNLPAAGGAGSNTRVQFNNAGNLSSANALTYDSTTGTTSALGLVVGLGGLQTGILTTGGAGTPGIITGTWSLSTSSRLNATYADLAERFAADAVYAPGTVVELGGTKEITAVVKELSDKVFGVISNTAGYIMNAMAGNDDTHPTVAMSGRVLVRVRGTVEKGDRLVSAGDGIARAAKVGEYTPFNTIGRALEDKTTVGIGEVLAAVSARSV